MLVEKKQISHNQSLGVFTVIGTTGNQHAIRIIPKESCTCPLTGRYYHIIAVRMSIGLEDGSSVRKVNLTQLRINTLSRVEKRSGRKAPRPGDYSVEPAPDANIPVRVFSNGIYNVTIVPNTLKNIKGEWR